MTFTKLFGFALSLAIIMSAVKIFFFQSFNWDESTAAHYGFWFMAGIFSVAFIRRLGVISFLEAIVVSALWLLLQLIVDVIVTGPIVGYGIFIKPSFLMGYLIIVVAMFLFHKKRHIHIRKQLREGK